MKNLIVLLFAVGAFGQNPPPILPNGPVASMPACSNAGQTFYATDTKAFYLCGPAGTWTEIGGGGGNTTSTGLVSGNIPVATGANAIGDSGIAPGSVVTSGTPAGGNGIASGSTFPSTVNGPMASVLENSGTDPSGNIASNSGIAAVLAAHPGAQVVFPVGNYKIDNSAGAFTTTFSGSWIGAGQGQSTIKCTTQSNQCIVFTSPSSLTIKDITITYATSPVTRNNSHNLVINSGSHIVLENVALPNAPGVGFNCNNCNDVSLQGGSAIGNLANGYFFVNSSNVRMDGNYTSANGDAGLEFSQYDGQSGTCQDIAVSNYVSTIDSVGININSCKRVAITNPIIRDTFQDGIEVRQDSTTTTTVWPDEINIVGGTVSGTGSSNPSNAAVRAIHLVAPATTPSSQMHVIVTGTKILGGNTGSNSVQVETSNWWTAKLTGIVVENSGGECFDIAGWDIEMDGFSCLKAQSFGLVNRAAHSWKGYGRVYDAQLGGADTRAFYNVSQGNMTLSGLLSDSDQSTARAGVDDNNSSGIHKFLNVVVVTTDGTNPAPTNTGGNASWVATGTVNATPFTFTSGFYSASNVAVLGGSGPVTGVNGLWAYFSGNTGFLSATQAGTANRPLSLQGSVVNILSNGAQAAIFSGTSLGIGSSTTVASNPFYVVSGTANATSYATITNCTSTASPSVCGSAAAGKVQIAAAATTLTINTTAVTAVSQVGCLTYSTVGITAPTNIASLIQPYVSAVTAGTSFTITLPVAPLTNPVNLNYCLEN